MQSQARAARGAQRRTLDLGAAIPVVLARLASSSALKSVALRSTWNTREPHACQSKTKHTSCASRPPHRVSARVHAKTRGVGGTMELPPTPSISRLFFGFTMPSDDDAIPYDSWIVFDFCLVLSLTHGMSLFGLVVRISTLNKTNNRRGARMGFSTTSLHTCIHMHACVHEIMHACLYAHICRHTHLHTHRVTHTHTHNT
jgi:hypothetical protein